MNFAVLVLICATALAGPLLSLQRFAKIPVVIGDPRDQLDDSGGLTPELAARAAVALGLALDAPEKS